MQSSDSLLQKENVYFVITFDLLFYENISGRHIC